MRGAIVLGAASLVGIGIDVRVGSPGSRTSLTESCWRGQTDHGSVLTAFTRRLADTDLLIGQGDLVVLKLVRVRGRPELLGA